MTAVAMQHEFVERRRMPRSADGAGTRPVDRTYLRRFTMGNQELELEVLGMFADQLPLYVNNLRQATTAKAWHDATHTLKGSARAVGAWRIARVAQQAEKLRFDTDLDRRAFAVDSAQEAADEACRFIAELAATA